MNGTLAGIIAILMWSSTGVLLALTGLVSGLMMTFLILLIGSMTLTGYQIFKKEDVVSYWTREVKDYIFLVLGVGFYTSLVFISFKLVAPFEANTLNYLWPILLVLLTGILHEKHVSLQAILGSVLGFIGVVTLFFPQGGDMLFESFEWGHLLAFLAAVIWSIYSVMAKNWHYPQGVMAPALFYSALVALGFHLALEETMWPQGWEWASIIILGVFRISYSFWDYGMKKGNTVLLASLSYFIPLFSLGGLILIGEGPDSHMIGLGALFIVIGCLVVNYDRAFQFLRSKMKKP
ncbi:MAG: EamA family transporter [Alphaproteobacteria bacterium]|nr:EamA family transporter [Alphaproteobacteria bacterium]